ERIVADLRARRNEGLPRNFDARARAVEDQAVVAALDPLVDDLPARKRHAAVRAPVFQRGDFPVLVPEEDDVLVEDFAAQGFGIRSARKLAAPGCDVPVVADEHSRLLEK